MAYINQRGELTPSELLFKFFNEKNEVILYGATTEAKYCIENFGEKVYGLVDRVKRKNESWQGKTCLDSSQITPESLVINCVTAANCLDVYRFLKTKTAMVINFYDFISLLMPNSQFSISDSPVIRNWQDFPEVFKENISVFEKYKSLFGDDLSKKHYNDYLDGKILGDISVVAAGKSFQDPSTMYFQDFLPSLTEYTFIDVGSFDGKNSEAFLKLNETASVVCFEPNPDNAEMLRQRLKVFCGRYSVFQYGLGDKEATVSITRDGASSRVLSLSSETTSGEIVCQKTLDTALEESNLLGKKLFVKMDVEGAENAILMGALKTIANEDAIFAISCYHKARDLIDLFNAFQDQIERRQFYFRHLTSGACESVLFVI